MTRPDDPPRDAAWATHAAALDRLAGHRRRAEAAGWTACALEREGGTGAFALFGVPPGGTLRARIAAAADPAATPLVAEVVDAAARGVRQCAATLAALAEVLTDDEARERLARTGERAVWRSQDAARTALVAAVAAYTDLLRADGQPARRAAAAVAAAVRAGATPALEPGALAGLAHDAGCWSVERYYSP